MDVFGLCALAVGGLFMVILLRQYHPVFALAVSLALSLVLLMQALQLMRQAQTVLQSLFGWIGGQNFNVVLRVIGIGLIVQTTAELCHEAGQAALEGKIVLLGKLLILAAGLPLLGQVLEILSGLLL